MVSARNPPPPSLAGHLGNSATVRLRPDSTPDGSPGAWPSDVVRVATMGHPTDDSGSGHCCV
jgi:hypothetical protein